MQLSVLLSVYNDAPYVERAVGSILAQTWRDFEFIIVNDGSTDGSTEILRRLAASDPRIVLVEQENRGLVASLNRGFAMAKGDWIARMDGDDESLPRRFERQLAFRDAHPDHGVIGCQMIKVDDAGREHPMGYAYPTDFAAFLAAMETRPLMSHPGTLIDKAAFVKVGGYRSIYRHCEDYDLWLRLSEVTKLCSLDEVLYRYFPNPGQVTVRHTLETALGAAIAWEAHRAREYGRPDPTIGLAALPDAAHLDELDTIFDTPGTARRVRARIVPQILHSIPALAADGGCLVGDHVADGGARSPAVRAVARLLRHGEFRGARRLATAIGRACLAPTNGSPSEQERAATPA